MTKVPYTSRRLLLSLLGGGGILSSLGPALAAPPDAVAQVQTMSAGLTKLRKDSASKNFAQRFAEFAPVIDQVFDVTQFLHGSVGLRWGELSTADQAALLKIFRAYVIASYVANFNQDTGETIKVTPGTRISGADQIVATQLVASDGTTTGISYQLRDQGAGFKIIDVLIDGTISQVVVQRSDFRSQLSGQSNAAQLIAMLSTKVKTLSGGTVTP